MRADYMMMYSYNRERSLFITHAYGLSTEVWCCPDNTITISLLIRLFALARNETVARDEREADFKMIMGKYGDIICRICRSFAVKEADYEDNLQDCYVNIWMGLQGFRGESNVKTWLYRVALNTCVSSYKKRRGDIRKVDLERVAEMETTGENVFEESQWMNSLLSVLSPLDHSIMALWLDNLSYEEIAGVMGMNRNTVATRIRRSKDILSGQLVKGIL